MKKFLTLMLIFFSVTSVAFAAKPIKIARLPIVIQSIRLDYETSSTLEMKIARAANIPLNQTLKIAEYLPPKESSKKFNTIWQKMYAENRKAKISDVVIILADDLKADLIICPILREYNQSVIHSGWNFESYLSSYVSAEMIVYDKSTGTLIDKRASRSFRDNYNKFGTASYLAGECFDQLIRDTGLRQIIRSKRG